MSRILIVGNDADYFFSHRQLIADAAREAGYQVEVAIPYRHDDARISGSDLKFHRIPLDRGGMNPFSDLGTVIALFRLFRKVRPDIVHHFTIKPVLYGGCVARLTGVPHVINAMTGLGTVFASKQSVMGWLKKIVILGLRFACQGRSCRTVLQNAHDRNLFIDLGITSRSNSCVISGSGVDTEKFRPEAGKRVEPLVVFPSRLLWDKGLHEFIEAGRILSREFSQARFVLVGGTDPNPTSVTEERLESLTEEGFVEWWGYRSDMPDIYRQSLIVCLPSYHEGLPKSLVEAAASGCPIVTTDIPGCRDVVEDGNNGLLVKPRDIQTLAAALRKLLQNPDLCQQFGRNGRERAVRHFSANIIVRETLALYAGMLK